MVLGLFGGGKVEISIDVDQARGYAPGDTVEATITLSADKGMKAREVRAGLVIWEHYQTIETTEDNDGRDRASHVWRTDEEWLHRETLLKNEGVPSGFNQSYTFSWQIPEQAPAPCEGKIVQIRYLVKVTVDRAMAKDVNQEQVLQVALPAPGRYVAEGEFGRSKDNEARMRFLLPRLEYVEGETLTGKLVVEPRQAFDAQEIRVELNRQETVTPGDRTNRATIVEQKLQLSPAIKLEPGATQEYQFSLPIPARACPSHDTSKTRNAWVLEGIVDRRMRDDVNVEQEVYVYNIPARDGGAEG